MKARRSVLLVALACIASAMLSAQSSAPSTPTLLAPGTPAPDFVSFDLAGGEVRISDYRGKVLILDFWATWCGPCIASMPHTQEIAAKYADQDVVVLAVCTGDKRKRFEDWVKLKSAAYPGLRFTFDPHEQGTPRHEQRASFALYGVPAIPTQFIIGRDGRIAGTTSGYITGDNSLEKALAAAGVKVDAAVLAQPGRRAETRSAVATPPAEAPRSRPPVPPFRESLGKVKAGDTLPDLELRRADGSPAKLSEFRGQPLVLLFATAEMIPPEFLNGVVEKYGAAGVRVLALVTRDTPEAYAAWLALHGERGHRFATAFDPAPASDPRNGAIFRAFQFGAPTPFACVLDADGRFVGLFPWKVEKTGAQGLAELLRRCGVPVSPEDLPAAGR